MVFSRLVSSSSSLRVWAVQGRAGRMVGGRFVCCLLYYVLLDRLHAGFGLVWFGVMWRKGVEVRTEEVSRKGHDFMTTGFVGWLAGARGREGGCQGLCWRFIPCLVSLFGDDGSAKRQARMV
ncbi:hypothetical protein B0J18DRAFT_137297 [Chaetomium sp. MPI-SDFR-AT-0129]|nr:hypothetical protein B0J18DRAFT_137297 [Chaetomium sp. MPI-SDFR-AT-0129]